MTGCHVCGEPIKRGQPFRSGYNGQGPRVHVACKESRFAEFVEVEARLMAVAGHIRKAKQFMGTPHWVKANPHIGKSVIEATRALELFNEYRAKREAKESTWLKEAT